MFICFKFAYQLWHTLTKEQMQKQVDKGTLTPDEYKEIVGEDYPEKEVQKSPTK